MSKVGHLTVRLSYEQLGQDRQISVETTRTQRRGIAFAHRCFAQASGAGGCLQLAWQSSLS
jgi:hypothetical protein